MAVITALLFIGGLTHGFAGAGIGLLATPFIAVLEPRLVPGAMLVPGLLISAAMAFQLYKHAQMSLVLAGLIGRFPGTLIGAWIVSFASPRLYAWLFATCVAMGLVFSIAGPRVRPTSRTMSAAGFLSGLMSTLTAIGGTPIMLLMQHGERQEAKGTMSLLFGVGTLMSILSLLFVGRFSAFDLQAGLLLSVPTCLGLAASPLVSRRLESTSLRPYLLGLAAFSIVPLLLKALFAPG